MQYYMSTWAWVETGWDENSVRESCAISDMYMYRKSFRLATDEASFDGWLYPHSSLAGPLSPSRGVGWNEWRQIYSIGWLVRCVTRWYHTAALLPHRVSFMQRCVWLAVGILHGWGSMSMGSHGHGGQELKADHMQDSHPPGRFQSFLKWRCRSTYTHLYCSHCFFLTGPCHSMLTVTRVTRVTRVMRVMRVTRV